MKWFAGLVFCLLVGLTYSEEDVAYLSNYYCYLDKVFQYKENADLSGGWCQHKPKIAKYQIQAAEECQTGFADAARKYYDNLSVVCSVDLEKGLEGNCASEMFTDPGIECYVDYFAEFKKTGTNSVDPVSRERFLCKYFDKIMACHYKKIAQKCKKDYPVFLQVMDPYRELQHSVCAILPTDS